MDAKRIIAILQVRSGQVTDVPEGSPAAWARRLEIGGADEIIFLEAPAAPGRAAWIREVAGSLFIPFSVQCAFPQGSQLEEVLEAGADKALLTLGPEGLPQLAKAALRFGRNRLAVSVSVSWTPEQGWRAAMPPEAAGRDALAWMEELGQMGAGEILLDAGEVETGLEGLWQGAAQLALPILWRATQRASGLEALLNGVDGLAFSPSQGSPGDIKAALGHEGLALRQ
jgi:imidazole glycerol phosphate synthase subunit HisF